VLLRAWGGGGGGKEFFEGVASQNRVLQDRVDVLTKFVRGTQVCQEFESLDEASFQLEIDEFILEKVKMRVRRY